MTIFHGALEKIENSKTYDLSYETFDDYSLLIGFFASEFFFNKSGPVFKEGGRGAAIHPLQAGSDLHRNDEIGTLENIPERIRFFQ